MSTESENYNRIYSETESAFGAGAPDKVVTDLFNYRQSGTALELGAGQGRNALFLAEHGFKVMAQDLSDAGIAQINKLAAEKGLDVVTQVSDARGINWQENFDVLVSTLMLHHLTHEEAVNLIKLMQEHTNPDGLNAITAFTPEGDFFRNNPETNKFYPTEQELRELYADWEVLQYEEAESRARQTKPDGSPMINTAARLLAKKYG